MEERRPIRVSETSETLGVCSGCKHHGMCELEAVCQNSQQVMHRRKQNHMEKTFHLIQINDVKLCRMCHGQCNSSIFNIYCTYNYKIFQQMCDMLQIIGTNIYIYVLHIYM